MLLCPFHEVLKQWCVLDIFLQLESDELVVVFRASVQYNQIEFVKSYFCHCYKDKKHCKSRQKQNPNKRKLIFWKTFERYSSLYIALILKPICCSFWSPFFNYFGFLTNFKFVKVRKGKKFIPQDFLVKKNVSNLPTVVQDNLKGLSNNPWIFEPLSTRHHPVRRFPVNPAGKTGKITIPGISR